LSVADASSGIEVTDVIVADNASTDDTIEMAKSSSRLRPRVVSVGRNAGYAAGINAGLRALASDPPDAVMVINPDCRLMPGTLKTMADAFAIDGRGIVAPKLINPDGSLQPTLRRDPTVRGALTEALIGGRLASRLGLGELIYESDKHARAAFVSWVTGAALMIPWAVLVELGPWDESFLLYSEETEYIFRAADRGWGTWYEPDAVVLHIGGDSGINPDLAALLTINKVELFGRRHGRAATAAYRGAVLLGESLRACTGRATARAAVRALTKPSSRIHSLAEIG
jgi:GT2 family glycosyltransferase